MPRRSKRSRSNLTSNRPLEDWGKLIGGAPSVTAILDRFLHHAEIISIKRPQLPLEKPRRRRTRGWHHRGATDLCSGRTASAGRSKTRHSALRVGRLAGPAKTTFTFRNTGRISMQIVALVTIMNPPKPRRP
jgi:hypothetical protein